MLKKILSIIVLITLFNSANSQIPLNYKLILSPIQIEGLPGLHSYAVAQHTGKWLIIGGRTDGLHARQPFNSFKSTENNTTIYVVDVASKKTWSASVSNLEEPIREQLQSTNMNFYQDGDMLYTIGGYAYAQSKGEHITFPYLTAIHVPSVINAIINQKTFSQFIQQIKDENFAVTGGQLGKIGDTFYLVGGHRFDGRYNPMGHPTFRQTYTNQIRKFKITNSKTLRISNYNAITDNEHLHRRDFNLLAQIFPDGTQGYTISSGVFQHDADLPFLYPVDITANGYTPIKNFNQYLSNYHSAKVGLYDKAANQMHTIFFGGISQHRYEDKKLITDNLVPFTKTISLLTRYANGTLKEFELPVEMPGLKGAGAEFIVNHALPRYASEIVKLNDTKQSTILLGYIYGGIESPSLNPFSRNQTNLTKADYTVYEVKLTRE
jgi:hypothetical protein